MPSYFRHNPPAPRNVGTPLSADIPAPVMATTDFADLSIFRNSSLNILNAVQIRESIENIQVTVFIRSEVVG